MLAVALAPGVPTVFATVRATTANDAKLSQSLAQQSCEAFENWFLDPSCRHSEFPSDAGPRHVEIGGEFARAKWALLDVADHESRDDLCILTLFGAAFVVGVGTLAKPARHFHAETRNDEVFLSELHRREATLFKETVGGESRRIGQHNLREQALILFG